MNKYRNIKTEIDGVVFASKKEARRYSELKLLEKAGEIKGLGLQPKYPIVVNEVKIGNYFGDFRYIERGELIIEDVKGIKTPAYRMKKKLVKAIYGINIRET